MFVAFFMPACERRRDGACRSRPIRRESFGSSFFLSFCLSFYIFFCLSLLSFLYLSFGLTNALGLKIQEKGFLTIIPKLLASCKQLRMQLCPIILSFLFIIIKFLETLPSSKGFSVFLHAPPCEHLCLNGQQECCIGHSNVSKEKT